MACRLVGAKRLSESMLEYCKFETQEQTSCIRLETVKALSWKLGYSKGMFSFLDENKGRLLFGQISLHTMSDPIFFAWSIILTTSALHEPTEVNKYMNLFSSNDSCYSLGNTYTHTRTQTHTHRRKSWYIQLSVKVKYSLLNYDDFIWERILGSKVVAVSW